MIARSTLPLSLVLLLPAACGGSAPAPAPDAQADAKAKEDAEMKARIEARKAERLAKEQEEKKKQEMIAAKIKEIAVIPEGTKMPKKPAEACEQVVAAQEGFMKKFHGQIEAAAVTTQLGMLRKQCNEMKDIKVSMCQKFALEATTEELKGAINEYLPVCMEKYGS